MRPQDPRRAAYVMVRLAQENLARVTAPITRSRYTEAHRDAALAELEAAVRRYESA
jgi:hypothetical protein